MMTTNELAMEVLARAWHTDVETTGMPPNRRKRVVDPQRSYATWYEVDDSITYRTGRVDPDGPLVWVVRFRSNLAPDPDVDDLRSWLLDGCEAILGVKQDRQSAGLFQVGDGFGQDARIGSHPFPVPEEERHAAEMPSRERWEPKPRD